MVEHEFLKEKYWKQEAFREAVEKSARKKKRLSEDRFSIPKKPEEQIPHYLERIEKIARRVDPKTGERGKLLKETLLYPQYIIKPENISPDYIKGILLGNFAEQHGYERDALKNEEIRRHILEQFKAETGKDFSAYSLPEEEVENVRSMVIKDQRSRLDDWFDYLTSEEAKNIPAAFRYWAFAEMLKLGDYDETRKRYNRRTETTAASFPELDQQALAMVFDAVRRKRTGEPQAIIPESEEGQKAFKKLLQSENFGDLYAFAKERIQSLRLPTERLMVTKGEWRRFPRGSKPEDLTSSLQNFNTKWCIAGEGYAEGYLKHSDIWVYFSEDIDGKNTIPRACIVDSKKQGITEVRGIMSDENGKQHLDDYITPVVQEKLKDLPGGEKWQRQMDDMKRLAGIHLKHLRKETLSKEDLRFLYEIDGKIQSTGYGKDPRIAEILSGRDIKDDLSRLLDVPRERISVTQREALSGDIKYHYGNLSLYSLTSAKDLKLPESVGGYLDLYNITSAEGLRLPESIGGNLDLRRLTSAKDLKFPESIGGSLDLGNLTSAEGLKLPKSIGGKLDLCSLTSAEKQKLRIRFPHLSHKIL